MFTRRRSSPPPRHALASIAALESRRLLSAAPSISLSDTITVPAGKSIQIPIAGDVSSGSTLTYGVVGGTRAGIVSSFHDRSNPYLDLYTSLGSLRFQLLADVAPNTVRQISGLVASGFYDGLTFHRVVNVNGFQYAQGGDPNGNGTGGPDFTFDDEFNPDALFTGSGQLATANVNNGASGKDANGSQFIITGAPARGLDFNDTIFGQLVRGGKTLNEILNVATSDYAPVDAVRIKAAQIVEDKTDAVLQLRASDTLGETTILVTARDAAGRITSRPITVNVVPDTDTYANTPPILQPIDPIHVVPGQTIVIPIKAIDLEGDDYDIAVDSTSDAIVGTIDQLEKTITVKVAADATGPIELEIGVKGTNAVSRGNITMSPGGRPDRLSSGLYDTQRITLALGDRSIERAVPATDEFSALPFGTIQDKLIATFRGDGQIPPAASNFNATINWGDGTVTSGAAIRELKEGQFAVFGTHTYQASGVRPITIAVAADNGSTATINTRVRVADPVTLVGRSLVITGTDGPDQYLLRLEDDGTISVNGGAARWPASDVDDIEVRLYDGDDTFDANVAVMPPVSVMAGDGNDTVFAGPGDDTIDGGTGADKIGGNGGDDSVNAGDGNDTVLGGSGRNILYGDGDDDRLIGSGGRDLIYGGDGNDRLYGRAGDDTLDGGAGVDRLYGEAGNDLLIGGSGNDRIYGSTGDDTLYGKAGSDTLNGGPGDNRRGDDDDHDVLIGL